MKVDEIRDRFLKFFEERGHKVYPSDSLVPANDPTLLFTGAGMNQFKEEFLGKIKGPRRAVTCQKCLRTADLENVGRTPDHHTFFEMLGNFSFGDYFKKEAILWAWEFLTKDMGLKEEELWVSVYKDDNEAYDIWRDVVKVPTEKILKFGEKENFWPSNAPSQGPNGPCGPCSEIFYGGPNGVEVWNLVFTQFDRRDDGRLESLPNKNIDTGMGLERIARVIQGKKTNFEIDSFEPIIDTIKTLTPALSHFKEMGEGVRKINAIADHIRAVTFAISDGVLPSNEERGYVIRKLIRKAFWYGRDIGLKELFLYKIVPIVAKVMKKPYPELTDQREDIAQVVLAEEERFRNTIQEGLERLEAMIEDCRTGILSGEAVFKLYDTYGFPLELTQEIAGERNIKLDLKGFEDCMKAQREKSRHRSKISSSIFAVEGGLGVKLPEHTAFIEDKEYIEAKVVQMDPDGKFIFLERTNFYGEKGGQVGDTGVLLKDGKVVAEVTNAIDITGRVQHQIKMQNAILNVGDIVTLKIDKERRESIKRNHTATHLLHHALRKVLGQHVKQQGSLVAPDRLRFDFTHFRSLTDDELSRVEELVNKNIIEDSEVCIKELALKEAKDEGAIALFGEKYGEKVRMVSVGDFSKELCGGTHVRSTGEIGRFKIISESSIASGTRRIEAVTAEVAEKKLREEKDLIREIASELKTTPDNILKEIEKLSLRIRQLEKRLDEFNTKSAQLNIEEILKNCKKIKIHDVIIAEVKNADMDALRKSSDAIRDRLEKAIFVLVSEKDGKFSMVVGTEPPLNAVKILNEIGLDFGIKGGGRPDFSQAGSKSGPDIKGILRKAEQVIARYL
jgi:alanyl-tRNA synthetase